MIFIRHSHRLENPNWADMMKLPLTNMGRQIADEFASNLPNNRKYRIFHSPVERCRETAQIFSDSLNKIQAKVKFYEKDENLSLYFGDPQEIARLSMIDERKFLAFWIAEHYNPEIIHPFSKFIQDSAKSFWKMHLDFKKDCDPTPICDIFITHDFNILGWLFGWGGIYQIQDWTEYLEGFAIILQKKDYKLFHRGTERNITYPYWFKNEE
jgi:hypothetical protein